MLLLFHITIALVSLVYSTYVFMVPSKRGLRVMGGMTAVTIGTGVCLILTQSGNITPFCVTCLAYIGGMSVAGFLVHNKLQPVTESI